MRPSLEYQHAFDLCAMAAYQRGGPVLVLASSAFYARELEDRLECCAVRVAGADSQGEPADPPARTIIWAAPDAASAEPTLQRFLPTLAPDGQLFLICSGPLARRLPEWQGPSPLLSGQPVGPWLLRKVLRRGGLRLLARYGFHGPASILWGRLGQRLEQGGRPDWADRCQFQMRARYTERGVLTNLAPVGVLVAARP